MSAVRHFSWAAHVSCFWMFFVLPWLISALPVPQNVFFPMEGIQSDARLLKSAKLRPCAVIIDQFRDCAGPGRLERAACNMP
ncbi:hypothetical protein K474DRAFT_633844 [Panus rudis PR-1116 ss-1]|nr:hypothetical protein K474DRAFT_633844 [Panus rudis PR-1116 ss-1]